MTQLEFFDGGGHGRVVTVAGLGIRRQVTGDREIAPQQRNSGAARSWRELGIGWQARPAAAHLDIRVAEQRLFDPQIGAVVEYRVRGQRQFGRRARFRRRSRGLAARRCGCANSSWFINCRLLLCCRELLGPNRRRTRILLARRLLGNRLRQRGTRDRQRKKPGNEKQSHAGAALPAATNGLPQPSTFAASAFKSLMWIKLNATAVGDNSLTVSSIATQRSSFKL